MQSRFLLGYQDDFTAEELTARRREVLRAIGSQAVALLQGAPVPAGYEPFRQWNDFYYLCGVEVPHSYLLLDGSRGQSTLYLPRRDERTERNEGPSLTVETDDEARLWTGVEGIRPVEALSRDLAMHAVVYLPQSPAEGSRMCRDTLRAAQRALESDPWWDARSTEETFRERVRSVVPGVEVRDLSPILDELRLLKSPAEIDLMRRAGQLSALAVTAAMRETRPGTMEYQLGAVADYLFLSEGARGGGYRAIIAGGGNAWRTHYYRNDSPLRDGDLVLMDYAPDLGYYTSDIGRMWPVGGAYLPWQRELYGLVVEYHKALLRHIRPDPTPAEVMSAAADEMRPAIAGWAFSKPVYREAALRLLDFQGHLSHGVGMAVHDVGDYHRYPLRPGTVFALDPQMWVPEEHLYIRCEDTIAITASGYENLTAAAPLELDEVERTMQERGSSHRFPAL